MALDGKFEHIADFAVYCDTGSEPEFINKYVDYFIKYVDDKYGFKIHKIMHKEGLENHVLSNPKEPRKGNFYTSSVPPFYTLSGEGDKGMLMRQCTGDYKTSPIKKFINSLVPRGEKYRMWIGISFDERSRMRISTYKKRVNFYPLVESFVHRQASIDYVLKCGVRPPQRSSCYFCPFHSDRYWDWLKRHHPKEFTRACEFEKKVQTNMKTRDTIFLHSSCKPLEDVMFMDENQLNIFPELIDECGGECGI